MEALSKQSDYPFEASVSQISNMTGLSMPTVSDGRSDLIKAGVVLESGIPGQYIIVKSFAGLCILEAESKESKKKLASSASVSSPKVSPKRKSPAKVFRMSQTDRAVAVRDALKVLGSPASPRMVAQAMKSLFGLVERDGFELADAVAVVRYCRDAYDNVNRFSKYLNLPYIWAARNFTELLTASRTTPAISPKKSYTPFAEPPGADQANRDRIARLRAEGKL
jgi:hypothetical protein